MDDEAWMRYALELALRGQGYVEPNPMVGAVIVRDGVMVGEGYHAQYGQAHAEVNAFSAAGEQSHGATLYVTLEPCCHQGKTPPCTAAVMQAGITRVVAAMADPFPRVAGQGIQQLRDAGITVEVGLCETEARRLNAPYLTRVGQRRAHVHAKWAMTLDGKIATWSGHSQWISGTSSRERVHQLRGRMDAIIVGSGTVKADDPLLTARPPGARIPCRVVLTPSGRMPRRSQLLATRKEAPVLLVTSAIGAPRLAHLDVEVMMVEPYSLREIVQQFAERGWTNVLVEGGGTLLGAFRDERLIDEVHVFIAPKLVGGAEAISPMRGQGATQINDGLSVIESRFETLGDDLYWWGRIAHEKPGG